MERLTHIFVYLATLRLCKTLFIFLMLPTFLLLYVGQASGTEHILTEAMGETVTMDDFTPTLAAGDTVIISASRTKAIILKEIIGTPGSWITFTNPSDARITLSDGERRSVPMLIEDCRYIHLLGNNYGSETYGIRLTGGSSCLRLVNTRDVEIAYFELYDSSHIGINMCQCWEPWTGTEEMKNVTIHHNYIHDVGGEGMYLGKSSRSVAPKFRDIQVYNNKIENCGWDGIQLGQTLGDNNNVYGNTIKNTGHGGTKIYCWDLGYNTADPCPGQYFGIVISPEHHGVNIYQNYIQDSYYTGISIHSDGDGHVNIHDNVVLNAGYSGMSINCSIGSSTVINNTVVSSGKWGIKTNTGDKTGTLRYNLLVANGKDEILSSYTNKNDNRIAARTATEYFTDATNGDFSLTSSSPAKGVGVGPGYSTTDYRGITRSEPDIGAYAYYGHQLASPKAPVALRIP